MREFFKPWRRKVGVLTLGLACVFAAGWVRSGGIDDWIGIRWNGRVFRVQSSEFGISLAKELFPRPPNGPPILWGSNPAPEFTKGFPLSPIRLWTVHYLPIVLPLALLSAYLMLSKPRPSAPKATEPAPTTRT